MAEKGFWPLYEGKHIEQFLVDIKPIERWVSLDACQKKYGKPPEPGPKLVFRDIARNTDERTCIAAVLPERSCAGHTLSGIESNVSSDVMACVLNSLALDFSVRLRTAGTHLSFAYVAQLAVPEAGATRTLPVVPTRSVAGTSATNVADLPDLWPAIASLNLAVAEAYALTPDDLAYILTAFPVLARKRPVFYAYLQERVREWKREVEGARIYAMSAARLARAAESPEPYATEPARQPAASVAFQQAAVLAWVVHKLHAPGYPVSRFRVQKMLYLIEAVTDTGLFTEFRKQAAGPYDPGLRYKGPEDIAVRQRDWLVARGDTHFEPGPNIEEALGYAPRYIDIELAERVLEEFRTFKDETLERWTTVHLAAVELQRRGEPATPEAVLAYIRSVPEWQEKLLREEFALNRIADALEGLRKTGLLPREGRPTL
ncbi:hypothetical protein HRbin36_01198 [bacterium HR36]|nr:hypothetical protein HRbin36_01198 [bacterium HR36]